MSLEKVFDVEIDGKDYKIEMTNLAMLNFERTIGMSTVNWAISALQDGQPKYEDMLNLLICSLRKHHPKLKMTVGLLTNFLSPKDMRNTGGSETVGDTLVAALNAAWVDEDDIKKMEAESLEDTEGDPLAEPSQDGAILDG